MLGCLDQELDHRFQFFAILIHWVLHRLPVLMVLRQCTSDDDALLQYCDERHRQLLEFYLKFLNDNLGKAKEVNK